MEIRKYFIEIRCRNYVFIYKGRQSSESGKRLIFVYLLPPDQLYYLLLVN